MLLFKQTLAFLSLTLVCLLSTAFEVDRTACAMKDVSIDSPRSRLVPFTVKPKAYPSMRLGGVELTPAKTFRRKPTHY
jgi:hypothetical protein